MGPIRIMRPIPRRVVIVTALASLMALALTAHADMGYSRDYSWVERNEDLSLQVVFLESAGHTWTYKPEDNWWVQNWREPTAVDLEWVLMDSTEKEWTVLASDDYPNLMFGVTDLWQHLAKGYTPNLDQIFAEKPEALAYMMNRQMQALARFDFLESNFLEQSYMMNRHWLDAPNMDVPTTTGELGDVLIAFRNGAPNGKADETPFAVHDGFVQHLRLMYGIWGMPTKDGIPIHYYNVTGIEGPRIFAPSQPECLWCMPGETSPMTGSLVPSQAECLWCMPGETSPMTGSLVPSQAECLWCMPGETSPMTGSLVPSQAECLSCMPGETSPMTGPTAEISSMGYSVASNELLIRLEFSVSVTEFSSDDIVVTNGKLSKFFPQNGPTETYVARIRPIQSGIITVYIPDGVAFDSNGNGNREADLFEFVVL